MLTETGDGDFFILRVDSITPAQARPLEEVRDQVVELWREAQRAMLAREQAEAMMERAKSGTELQALAAEAGLELVQTEPMTRFDTAADRTPSPALAARLFQIQLGEVTTASAPSGHLVAKLIEIQPADPAADTEAVTSVENSLAQALRGDLLQQFMADLRGQFGVTVNERALDELLATF